MASDDRGIGNGIMVISHDLLLVEKLGRLKLLDFVPAAQSNSFSYILGVRIGLLSAVPDVSGKILDNV